MSALAAVLLGAAPALRAIAGTVPVVELELEDAIPGVLAGAGRARQAEDIGSLREAAAGARLDRRGTDLRIGEHVEHGGEAVDLLLEQRLDGFRRDVATGEA